MRHASASSRQSDEALEAKRFLQLRLALEQFAQAPQIALAQRDGAAARDTVGGVREANEPVALRQLE
jgi:hypothetical protein